MLDFKIIQFEELRHLSRLFTAEKVAAKNDGTVYMGAFRSGVLIGIVGVLDMGNGHLRYKSDWVDRNFRETGIYSQLWKLREEVSQNMLTVSQDSTVYSAYCTPMSLNKYLKEGFVIQGETTKEIKYVKRTNYRKNETV